ncbi:MAG TPA: GNAT family N-acetyltransferase [Gaiellaceae bacterium]|nr:GNAT family N-acetyltransferase [Gaiellaceae bacterium]
MSDEIEIRAPTPDDLPAIAELYVAVKGRARPAVFDRWRLFDTPWGDSLALMALDGGRCVSLAVVWPAELRVGDERVLGGQGMDAVTHPDYRNRPRLFFTITRRLRDSLGARGIDVYFTFPNTRSIKILRVTGGTYLGEVGAWGVDIARRHKLSAPFRSRRTELIARDRNGLAEIVELASAVADPATIGVNKTATWLEWRYSEASCEQYVWLALHEGGRLTAAALLGERDPAAWGPDFQGLVRIHELFAIGEPAAAALLSGVVGHVARRGGRKVDILVKQPPLERAVERAGFGRETPRPMTAFVTREGLPLDPYDFAHWRVISGDMDFF